MYSSMMPSKASFFPQLYDITNLGEFFQEINESTQQICTTKTHCICLRFSQLFGQKQRKFCAKIHWC